MVQKAFTERPGLRGICRVFQLSFTTLCILLHLETQPLAPFKSAVLHARKGDTLELDELCGFVGRKAQKRWVWAAMNRSNRQIVAYVIGDRSNRTMKRLTGKIPLDYLKCCSYSDLWKSYRVLLSKGNHQMVDKQSGETAHIERWNCTLRQRLSRYVRRSLAFSKLDKFHHLMTKLFIFKYNLNVINT